MTSAKIDKAGEAIKQASDLAAKAAEATKSGYNTAKEGWKTVAESDLAAQGQAALAASLDSDVAKDAGKALHNASALTGEVSKSAVDTFEHFLKNLPNKIAKAVEPAIGKQGYYTFLKLFSATHIFVFFYGFQDVPLLFNF